jgi:catechol 2,3-dioxygenase-like lactoylglutathione lyase family enzyme
MAIQRMDNVGVVVDDLEAAIAFFVELGLELEGEAAVEGGWVDRVVGLDDVRVDIAMMRTPTGTAGSRPWQACRCSTSRTKTYGSGQHGDGAAPDVFESENAPGQQWRPTGEALEEFLFHVAVVEAVMSDPHVLVANNHVVGGKPESVRPCRFRRVEDRLGLRPSDRLDAPRPAIRRYGRRNRAAEPSLDDVLDVS